MKEDPVLSYASVSPMQATLQLHPNTTQPAPQPALSSSWEMDGGGGEEGKAVSLKCDALFWVYT